MGGHKLARSRVLALGTGSKADAMRSVGLSVVLSLGFRRVRLDGPVWGLHRRIRLIV